MSHPLFDSILVDTGYKSADGSALKYVDYSRPAPKALVDSYCKDYNINTDCSGACVNCQISQLNKYPNEGTWAVKVSVTDMYDPKDISRVVLKLKKFQQVKVLKREGEFWLVSATRYIGTCMKNESHKRFTTMNRALLSEKRCEECEGEFMIEPHQIEGFVSKNHITGFLIQCNFIPKEYEIPDEVAGLLSDKEEEMAKAALDPASWSKTFLSRKLRPHQQIANRCSAKYMSLRWGRRSGKSYGQAISILNYVFNTQFYEGKDTSGNDVYRGAIVLIISPFLSQISLIWDDIKELLKRNPELWAMQLRDVKTPFHQMEFSNGAVIKGFTTGASSKQEASTIRGQKADLIYADEVDYIPSDDLKKAIEPIMLTYPHVKMQASSTPKGKREWFYSSCREWPHFKEFYFPSTVLDNWDEIKATLDLTHDSFMQEYMADFIPEEMGVYQPHFISDAEMDFTYRQPAPFEWMGQQVWLDKPVPTWVYSIGVDWNTNAGTEIMVVGHAPSGHCFAVEAVNVPKQDWQMIKAENAIFSLHAKWNPRFIYVDAGHGVGQIEHMQAASSQAATNDPNHPDAKIGPKIKAYDFSARIEYRHPVTGEIRTSIAKPFLVENSVRHFENRLIYFPATDGILHNQLLNYIKAGISNTGMPRYGMTDNKIGDHRVDALNLALVAFKLEMTDFAKDGPIVTNIAISKGFGSGSDLRMIKDGGSILAEIRGKIPLGPNGQPATGLSALYVRHDPEYLKMREAERILEQRKTSLSRTASLTKDPRQKEEDIKTDRPGWHTDEEWKFQLEMINRRASARMHRRSIDKPKRNTI